MKNKPPLLALALLALLAVFATAKVQADACLNLPDYPANQVTFQVADYYPTPQTAISYLTADIQSGPLPSARYQAWCADGGTSFQELTGQSIFTPVLTGWLYSSCDPDLNSKLDPDHPASVYVSPEIWRQINWILNHKGTARYYEVQSAIWALVGGPAPSFWVTQFTPSPFNFDQSAVDALLAGASADTTWVPKCGDSIAAIIDRDPTDLISSLDDHQFIFLEVPFCPSVTLTASGFDQDLGCKPTADQINAALGSATATDSCGNPVAVTSSDSAVTGTDCLRSQSRTFIALNSCGRSDTKTVTVTWKADTTAPDVSVIPGRDLGCKPTTIPNDNDVKSGVTATDNCSPLNKLTILVTHTADSGTECAMSRVFTISVTDECQNTTTKYVTYTWRAVTTAPTITGLPVGRDLGCNPANPPTTLTGVGAAASCTGSPTVTIAYADVTTGCKTTRTFTVTATDSCGNQASGTVAYTWTNDIVPPTITGTTGLGRDLGCNPVTLPTTLTGVGATDNCTGSPTVNIGYADVTTGCKTTRTFTVTATDSCGNKAGSTVVYTWTTDTSAPTFSFFPADASLRCNSDTSTSTTGTATATDNCGYAKVTYSDTVLTDSSGNTVVFRVWCAKDSCGNSTCKTQKITVAKCGIYETYTPGGWGAPPNGNNVAQLLANKFSSVYGSAGVKIGGSKYLICQTAYAVQVYLPSGGTPNKLDKNYTNPTGGTGAGEFATQVLALKFNVDFSNKGYIKPGLPGLHVAPGNKLAGYTVTQVLAAANLALGGGALPAGCTYSDLTNLLGNINGNYDNATTDNGFLVP